MTLSKELLMQFVDGELSPGEATRIEAELENNAQARAFVQEQTDLREQFRTAFAPTMEERVPDRLLAAAANTPVSWRWRLRQGFSRPDAWVWTGLPAAGALALGLAIGVIVIPSDLGPVATKNGTLVAQGVLDDALNTQLASAAPQANAPHIGISFRAKDGRTCRTFETDGIAGIACRGDAHWEVAALASSKAQAGGAYRMAGSAMPDVIRDAAEQMIAGAPFDAAAERRARDRGWK
ncbi:MAG TPA: hypothetical protein VG891_04220 [Rhizomicrobium sp.]|nr:hypothetical protein [Rhizomicrobium sp.]